MVQMWMITGSKVGLSRMGSQGEFGVDLNQSTV